MTAPRAALYARVSTDEQNTDLQVEELHRLAEQRGWSVVGEYVDHGISGVKESRPALDALLADAQAGKLDLVAVWNWIVLDGRSSIFYGRWTASPGGASSSPPRATRASIRPPPAGGSCCTCWPHSPSSSVTCSASA